jgi:threonine aldolase
MNLIDFRSDTVTKPTKEMLDFMFQAEVGDDVYGEDLTVNALEQFASEYFGKEAALFCVSGTQSNQIGLQLHLSPGGEVICHSDSHIYRYEGGGIAKNSGASVKLIEGNYGRLKVEQVKMAVNPDDIHLPLTQLVSLEDTANKGGGAVYDFKDIIEISTFCKSMNLPLHLDGARMMNALAINGIDPKEYASHFDTISLCLSKGLGAPIGSLLIGSKEHIKKARRIRKSMGGGMRQAGYIAAAGLYALKNNISRLQEDHEKAYLLGESLKGLSWVKTIYPIQTNIVIVELSNPSNQNNIIQLLKEKQILCNPFGPTAIRFVTHLDISFDQIQVASDVLKSLRIG